MTVVKKKPTTTSDPSSPIDNHLRRRRHRTRLHLISAVTSSIHTFLHRKHHHDHLNPSQIHSLSSALASFSSHLLLSLLTPSLSASLPSSLPPSSALSSASPPPTSPLPPAPSSSSSRQSLKSYEDFSSAMPPRRRPSSVLARNRSPTAAAFGGSVLVQALVESEGRFLHLSAGWDGGLKGSVILGKTGFFRDVKEGRKLLCGHKYELKDGFRLSQYVLGEACFPLLPWLFTPYGRTVTRTVTRCNEDDKVEDMGEFNRVHAREMGSVQKAFSMVRSRWRLLSVLWDEDWAEDFTVVVFAACLLNNFLIECGESVEDGYVGEEDKVVAGEEQHDEGEDLPAYEGAVDECGSWLRMHLQSTW